MKARPATRFRRWHERLLRTGRWPLRMAQVMVLILLVALITPAASTAQGQGWDLRHRPARADLGADPTAAAAPKSVTSPLTVSDPGGDTFGSGPTQLDVLSLSVTAHRGLLDISLSFAAPISAPDSGQPNAIDGFVDIDVDQNVASGDLPFVDSIGGGASGLGNEFYVDLFSYSAVDGSADLVDDPSETVVARVPIDVGDSQLTVSIPFWLLADDGALQVAAVVGTLTEPTDIVPNRGSVSSGNPIVLNDGRFHLEIEWTDFQGNSGPGLAATRANDSAVVTFFHPDNWEMVIKVLDACDVNDHFWLFYAAATNVGLTVNVTDSKESTTKGYTNDVGEAAGSRLDTLAFATCP